MKGNEHVKTNKGNHIMKNRNIHLPGMPVILTAVILLVFVTLVSPSQAERARTYDGTLTGGTFYCNGEPIDYTPTITGTWNLIIDPQTSAQLTLNVFVDGRHDVAFGYNALILISHDDGVYVFSAFGGFATATLDTSVTPATFSWHVEFGISCPDQNPFNSLTFFGVANRGGG
jgi:hypothetical protein